MSTQTPSREGSVLLTPADAARLANVSRETVYREIERGCLPSLRAGRQLRIDPGRVPCVGRAGGRVSWKISIPFTSREDTPVDMLDATRALPTDEARITRQLVLGAFTDGWGTSAGALLDHLEAASPSERRKLLDRARLAAGLESTKDIDFRERHKQHQRNALARVAGAPPPRLALSESGGIIDLAEIEVERKRVAADEESRRKFREDREAERKVEAEAMREHERAQRERFRRESPQGFAA